jgi:hypothetical protein
VCGQSPVKQFLKLRSPEKAWVITHPFIAKKCLKITHHSLLVYNKVLSEGRLDTRLSGGKADAFRHGIWMAMLSQQIKKRKALSLGKAHEKSNYKDFKKGALEDNLLPDKESSEMDLFNNCIGAAIGNINKTASVEELTNLIINSINKGEFVVIKINEKGAYVTCDNIPLVIKEKSWISNKCLVPSSFNL